MKFHSYLNSSTHCYISIKIKCEELCELIRVYSLKDKSGHFLQSWNNGIMLFEHREDYSPEFHNGEMYDTSSIVEIVGSIPVTEQDLPEQLHLIIGSLFIEIPDALAIHFKAAIRTAEHIEMISEREGIQPSMVDRALGITSPYNYFVRATFKDRKYKHESNHTNRYDSRFEDISGSPRLLIKSKSQLEDSSQSILINNPPPASSDIWDFELNSAFGKTITLTKYKGSEVQAIVPATIDGYKVIRLENTFASNKQIREVIISDGIATIDKRAFFYCSNLKSIQIPNSVTRIGSFAFQGCTNLCFINIPENCLAIGEGAFQGCSELRQVKLSNHIEEIAQDAFRQCMQLEEINVPDSLSKIGASAFLDCKKLCKNNDWLIINGILFEYRGCEDTVIVPAAVEEMSSECMPARINTLVLPDSIPSINHRIFKPSAENLLERLYLPNNLKKINASTFSLLENLREIIIPGSVIEIERKAFFECSSLRKVFLIEGTKSIGPLAFSQCLKLSAVHIPESVLDISEDAFSIRKSLKFFTRAGSYAEKFANAHGIAISDDYLCMADETNKQKYYLGADKGSVNL